MTTAVEPKSHTLEINGLALHYVEYPSPAAGAIPLVMLHGLTSAWGGWRRIAEHFALRYRVIALDQRGHGDSQWAGPDGYGTAAYLSDFEQFVDRLGLERFILVGQSMGGHHTIAYTARHPERVVCALANDIPPALKYEPSDHAQDFPGGAHRTFATVEDWLAPWRVWEPLTPEWARQLSARELLRAVDGGFQPKHDPNAVLHWQPADLWDEARTIVRPILFIRGGQSDVLDAQTLMDMDLAIEPARSITLEQASHSTFYDMEHEWLAVADAFFAAHAR